MARNGFLIRGTLRPSLGSMTGVERPLSASQPRRPSPQPKPPNRIPSSITVKRNPGARG